MTQLKAISKEYLIGQMLWLSGQSARFLCQRSAVRNILTSTKFINGQHPAYFSYIFGLYETIIFKKIIVNICPSSIWNQDSASWPALTTGPGRPPPNPLQNLPSILKIIIRFELPPTTYQKRKKFSLFLWAV